MGFWNIFNFLKVKVAQPVYKAFGGTVNYQQNDPTTPDLAVTMEIPALPNPCPPFAVQGFTGQSAPAGTLEQQALNVYVTMVLSLRYVQSSLQKPIIRWPALTKLIANPRAGKMFNAYYDRYYLNFFFDVDPKTGQTIYTCDSTDVVAHELGHAILDCIRPDLWAVQCVEIQSFHEAFGDINAMLFGMNQAAMLTKMLEETKGDLSQHNCVSRIAEQMGVAIQNALRRTTTNPYLRSAINNLQYAVPESLPTRAPDDQLAGEPHSFSRVFTGAWYDSLVNIYNELRGHGIDERTAATMAHDKLGNITYNSVRFAPINARFYKSVLSAMIAYDAQQAMGCGNAIRAGFAKHNLFPDGTPMAMVEQGYENKSPVQEAFNLIGSYTSSETARIADFATEGEDNPLYKCIVELAKRHEPGKFLADISDLKEAISAAKHSLKVLADHERVGHGPTSGKVHDHEFTVIDGRLVRNYFCCACRR